MLLEIKPSFFLEVLMTTLTFNAFTNGQPASAEDVNSNFYEPQTFGNPATSCEIINGWLDGGNWSTTEPESNRIGVNALQPGCLTIGGMVGATLNHDYFPVWFKQFNHYNNLDGGRTGIVRETGAGQSPESLLFVGIPGGAIDFYVPYAVSFIILSWTIRWTHDGEAIMQTDVDWPNQLIAADDYAQEQAAIRLFIQHPENARAFPAGDPGNTKYTDNYRRNIGQVMVRLQSAPYYWPPIPDDPGSIETYGGVDRFDYSRHREWSGHMMLGGTGTDYTGEGESFGNVPSTDDAKQAGVSPGWYGASLRIASSARQARVQVRSMRYTCFKLEETGG